MLSVMTHFGLRICISRWESSVVAGMCLTPFGATSASAPSEAAFFRAETSHSAWVRHLWFLQHLPWLSRRCPRKDRGGLITRCSKPEDRGLLQCAVTSQGRTCREAPPPNIRCKTSCAVVLLCPFPRARPGRAGGAGIKGSRTVGSSGCRR